MRCHGRLCYGDGTVGDHQDPVGALSVGHEVNDFERNGDPHGAGRHISQKPVAGTAGLQRFQRANSQDGTAKVAVGAGGASHLLADDRDFGECGARSAELLGHLQPGPTGVDESRPVDAAVLGQQITGYRPELFVELREFVCRHTALGSLGSPSPRSAMIVRWISLDPRGWSTPTSR